MERRQVCIEIVGFGSRCGIHALASVRHTQSVPSISFCDAFVCPLSSFGDSRCLSRTDRRAFAAQIGKFGSAEKRKSSLLMRCSTSLMQSYCCS